MPIRILFVTGSYPPDRCGVGDYTQMLATVLAALPATQVSVLTTGGIPSAMKEHGVAVYRSMPDWSLRQAGSLIWKIRGLRPDIVHVQYPTQGYREGDLPWLVPLLAFFCGARIVQTWHEGFNRRDLLKFLLMVAVPGRIVVVREVYLRQIRHPVAVLAGRRRPLYINSASTLPRATLSLSQLVAVREKYCGDARRLIVFFGFLHPLKRIEMLFEIADPAADHLVIVGEVGDQSDYAAAIETLSRSERWLGRSSMIGYVDAEEAAAILRAADAVVLPLQLGGGEWNTSILAGILQGTFVLTTSTLKNGYDTGANVYYARIDDVGEMRQALQRYAGVRRTPDVDDDAFSWPSIAKRHLALYRSLLPSPPAARNESRSNAHE